jgi:membrane-bound lytic murein transglycosylase D
MVTKRFVACLAVAGAILWGLPVSGQAAEEPFPEYTVVKPNVSFWISIYTRYATTQAVVHDSVHLDVVYDVVDLEPADSPGACKINRQRMKTASQKYTQILQRLAADPSTQDADCRRVAALFEAGADADVFQRASHQVRCQIGQRDRFQDGLVRSGAHIDQIRAIMKSYGVPEDLAYLPHVESSFDGNAYSKFGAAGMWQFTRSTGKRFLTVDTILDERRDPIAATHAAAQLLKENHEKLGSWPLAITAYNHGAAGMERAKAAHGNYPRIFTAYNGRSFKFASRNFYSEFLAARNIASDYQRYFGDLELAEPISYSSMRLEGFVAFTELCHRLGFDPEIVRSMNPALRPTVFNGQKLIPQHYRLNLPSTTEFNSGVSPASLLSGVYQHAQKPSRFYMVQRGDTAGKIARMHHVKLEDLMMANNLTPRATVYVRQRLCIPQPGAPIPPQEDVSPEDMVRSEVVLAIADTPPEEARILASIPVESDVVRYRRPGPAPADLLAMVDLEDDHPLPSQVGHDLDVAPTVVNAQVAFARIEQAKRQPVGILYVEVEETIGHYAEWAGVRASRIRHLNNLPFGKPLQLHQAVQIPLESVAADAFEARRLSFHKQLQKDFFAAYRVGELQQYRVKPGDSYWTLCREKFDLPLWLLQYYNKGVNLAALRADQPLTIPAIETIPQERSVGFGLAATPDV